MAGRKVFTSGEILTAADVNSFLMDQSVMVFADSTARSSAIPSPSEGMTTYLQSVNQLQVYDGSQFGPVGSVLQVVSTTVTTVFSTSASGFQTVTNFSATITPTSATSTIQGFMSFRYGNVTSSNNAYRIDRGGTAIALGDGTTGLGNPSGEAYEDTSAFFVDSPATTSATTYQLEVQRSAGTLYVGGRGVDGLTQRNGYLVLMEVAG